MNTDDELLRLTRLQRLTRHRESAALVTLSAAREAMDVAQLTLDAQQQVIDGLEFQLQGVLDWAAGEGPPSARNLLALSERRRWLIFDLEKEQYYHGVAQSDWRDTRRQVIIARRAWLAMRHRLDALESRRHELDVKRARQTERFDSLVLDDRTHQEFTLHG